MNVSKDRVLPATLAVFVYLVMVSYGLLRVFAYNTDLSSAIWVLMPLQLLRLALASREDPLQISLSATFALLFAPASVGITYLYGTDLTLYVAIYILYADLVVLLSGSDRWQTTVSHSGSASVVAIVNARVFSIVLLLCISVIGNEVFRTGVLAKLIFIVPFGLSLLVFESLLRAHISKLMVLFLLLAYMSAIWLFIELYWSGFGRIRIGSYILMPILLANFYRDIGVRVWQLIIATPILIYIAQASRYGGVGSAETFFLGSAGVHLIFTDDLWGSDISQTLGGFSAWLDQFLLLFLNWFPSALWYEKPIGLGYSSVDDWIGREGFSDGYSISIGFIGEQLYLLGDYFVLGLIATLGAFVILRRLVHRFSYGFVAPLVMFDVNLMSYFWGGGSTFGSRAAFFIVPILAAVVIYRLYTRASFSKARRAIYNVPV